MQKCISYEYKLLQIQVSAVCCTNRYRVWHTAHSFAHYLPQHQVHLRVQIPSRQLNLQCDGTYSVTVPTVWLYLQCDGTYSVTTYSVTVPTVWLYLQCDCTYNVTVPTVWLYLQCDCTYSVTVPTMWLYLQCDGTYSVTVPTVWRYLQCDCTYSVTVPTVWRYLQCDCTYSVTVPTVWRYLQCDCTRSTHWIGGWETSRAELDSLREQKTLLCLSGMESPTFGYLVRSLVTSPSATSRLPAVAILYP